MVEERLALLALILSAERMLEIADIALELGTQLLPLDMLPLEPVQSDCWSGRLM